MAELEEGSFAYPSKIFLKAFQLEQRSASGAVESEAAAEVVQVLLPL